MNRKDAVKRIYELHDRCNDELEAYYKQLKKQGVKYFGLDGPKTEIEQKYDRMIKDIISEMEG